MSTRIICESGVASLLSSRQRLILQHKHALQGGYHTSCQRSPRMESSLELLKKYSVRRFSSSGGMKSPKRSVISGTKDSTSREPVMPFSQFLKSYLQPKPMPDRWSSAWYREMALICTVFAITGSSTMVLVRPAVSKGLGLEGSLKDGPWSFRICSLVVMTPIYATLLLVVGTVFGRHAYFRHFSVKMWSRFGIPPEMIDKSWHTTKKNFRKW